MPLDLTQVLDSLRSAREETAAQLDEVNARGKELAIELDKIDQMIRAGGGGARKRSTGPGGGSTAVGPEVVAKVREQAHLYAEQEGPAPDVARGAFTRQMMVKDLGIHPSSIDKALRQLRTTNEIRMAGKKRLDGSPRASNLHVLTESALSPTR